MRRKRTSAYTWQTVVYSFVAGGAWLVVQALSSHFHTHIASAQAQVLPTLPVSGEQALASAPLAATLAKAKVTNPALTTLFLSGGAPAQLRAVVFDPSKPEVTAIGRLAAQAHSRQVWVQIEQVSGAQAGRSWTYTVPVRTDGVFAAALDVPFGAGEYRVTAALPLRTSQTSLTYKFADKAASWSPVFKLSFAGHDSARTLGLLTSTWADWTTPSIIKLAQSITNGLSSPLQKAQAVYRWEASHLDYNGELLQHGGYGWSTTQETLARGMGICVDYANVADALLRALAIPTQMIVGYASDEGAAVADNGSSGHAWNRSFIGGHWIYFDPTWSREYFLSPVNALPTSSDLYLYQPQWFNPPQTVFAQTHQMSGVEDQ